MFRACVEAVEKEFMPRLLVQQFFNLSRFFRDCYFIEVYHLESRSVLNMISLYIALRVDEAEQMKKRVIAAELPMMSFATTLQPFMALLEP